jgi:transcriptional regulator with PAS, ATPase and Fis domain
VNLEKKMLSGSFREDLYYRLNRMPIFIPPLRERKADIEQLAVRLIEKMNQEYGRHVKGVTDAGLASLMDYRWPGNVRELENILGRAMIFMNKNEIFIDAKHLLGLTNGLAPDKKRGETPSSDRRTLTEQVEEYEKKIIKIALKENNGNKTMTAKSLGVSVRNLYYKLDKYNLANIDVQ